MLATAPLAELLFPEPHYARGGFDYWQQTPDRRLILGGCRDRHSTAEQTTADEITDAVQADLERLVVQLVGELPPIEARWSGAWAETPDLVPLAGPVPGRDRVWVAGGYSGHGNVLGFACGDLVARALAGESPSDLALFDPSRFNATRV